MVKGGLRISIRYQLLLVISGLLLLAIGAYVYLASTLFTRDKLAYVFDAQASQVSTVAEQTRAQLGMLTQVLSLFARDASTVPDEQGRQRMAEQIFRLEPELVFAQLYRQDPRGFQLLGSWAHPAQLDATGLSTEDLRLLREEAPLPLEAIAAQPGELLVRNASLPPDAGLLTVALSVELSGKRYLVAAELRPQRLLRTVGSSRLHDVYLLDERGVVLAHADPQRVIQREALTGHPLVKAAQESQVDHGVHAFSTPDGVAMLGGYRRVEGGRLIALSQLPREEALRAGSELLRRSLLFAAAVVLFALLVSIFLSRVVTSPIRALREATEVVAQGRFQFEVNDQRRDEMGDLARAFVHMSRALREAQAHLVRSEKLAAFGQLGAGITHELKNPLTGIVGFAQIAQRKLAQPEKLAELLKLIEQEGLRCRDILVNFLKFAHQQSGHDTTRVSPAELVQNSARIVRHQLGLHSVHLELELAEELPALQVNAGEIQQVLLNLAINAQQAMPQGGRVRFITRPAANQGVEIVVSDNGPGIPEEHRDKIFDPFFTTKAPGEGTGLGLAISFGIIRDHGGTLRMETELGRGTTFILQLPPAPPLQAEDEDQERRAANA